MAEVIDARGLPCPQPVIRARNAMRAGRAVTVLISDADQVANVRRLAEKAGWRAVVTAEEGYQAVELLPGEIVSEPEITPEMVVCQTPHASGAVLVLTGETLGRGDDELGAILMRSLFHTLTELEPPPQRIILFNTGVRLAVAGSPVLEDLRALQARGVEVLACGTCLGHYELKERLAVGSITNMYTIAEALLGQARVVTL